MADFSDYPHLTKCEKSRFKSLKKAIFEVFQKLGSGVSNPVPYDTAWVARIPQINESGPAFPESLQWLRHHQAEDGSWGEAYPLYLHSKLLNTFAAVLALSQWNYKDDEDRVRRGIKAIEIIIKSLPQEETKEKVFEMIISSFLDDSRELNLTLAYEQFERFFKTGKEKLETVKREMMSNKPNKYWSFLEAAGSLDLELTFYRPQITQYGLIAAQPSTTAFLLRYARLRKEDFPEAEWMLKHLCAENQGGIPHLVPLDNFELIHGLDYFFKVGINPRTNVKHAVTQKAIDSLVQKLNSTNKIGFSSNWPIADNNCTTTALRVLQQSSCKNRNLENLMSEVFEVFHDSDDQSLNNGFSSLKSESIRQEGIEFRGQESIISEQFHVVNKEFINGVQNISSYYSVLQYVVAYPKHAFETFDDIEHFFSEHQNDDGGWGDKSCSSVEETAYVCLAIFHLIHIKKNVLESVDFPKLVKFMNTNSLSNGEFWLYKVTFRSSVLTEALITAAKYAIFQIQRLCMFTDVVADSKLEFLEVQFRNGEDQFVHRGLYPLVRPVVRRQDIEVSKAEAERICKSILQTEQLDAYMQKLFDNGLEFSYSRMDCKMPLYERVMDATICVIFYIIDDWFDSVQVPNVKTNPKDIVETMKVFCKIFRGNYLNVDSVPVRNLPRHDFIWRWCFHCKMMMEKKNWNIENFTKLLEESIFKYFSIACTLQYYDIEMSSKSYLKNKTLDGGLIDVVHFGTLLQDNTIDSTEFENDALLLKYVYFSCKAARTLNDVLTVFKDIKLSQSDNYCLKLMQDYGISFVEAMKKVAAKSNKEVLKMLSVKKLILARKNENNEKLMILMRNVEGYSNGTMLWSLNGSRYEAGQKTFVEQIEQTKKDLTFTYDLCFNQNYCN